MSTSSNLKERELWIDVAKGFGIVAVVAGHVDGPMAKYIYWFHMPLFFMLSGYLFKPMENADGLRPWLSKRARQLLIPYGSFVVVLLLARYLQYPPVNLHQFGSDLTGILLGGRLIPKQLMGLYAVVWFITCLYVTQVLFMLITLKWKSAASRLAVIVVAYLLAHLEARINQGHRLPVPWDVDVALIAVSYYALGFFGKSVLRGGRRLLVVFAVGLVLSVAFVMADRLGKMDYNLDMKYVGYYHPVLDLIIPAAMMVVVCMFSHMVARTRMGPSVALLGAAALPIMYMHMYVNEIAGQYFTYGIVTFTVLGLAVPLAVWWLILKRFSVTRRLFLGST